MNEAVERALAAPLTDLLTDNAASTAPNLLARGLVLTTFAQEPVRTTKLVEMRCGSEAGHADAKPPPPHLVERLTDLFVRAGLIPIVPSSVTLPTPEPPFEDPTPPVCPGYVPTGRTDHSRCKACGAYSKEECEERQLDSSDCISPTAIAPLGPFAQPGADTQLLSALLRSDWLKSCKMGRLLYKAGTGSGTGGKNGGGTKEEFKASCIGQGPTLTLCKAVGPANGDGKPAWAIFAAYAGLSWLDDGKCCFLHIFPYVFPYLFLF
jgi:hypothetical protein